MTTSLLTAQLRQLGLNPAVAEGAKMEDNETKTLPMGDGTQNPDSIRLPGMEIKEELGAGGFGAVYRAHQKQFGRDVAVKVLHDGIDVGENEDRFLSEAIITGNLQHPNIIPVHDLGKDSRGRQFFTMKIAAGTLLSDIINKLVADDDETAELYDLPRLLQIFLDICDAVAYAHSQGIIHRDLKPNNIVIGDYGQVYVLDWGIAKVKGEEETESHVVRTAAMAKARLGVTDKLTMDGTVMGTPGYMSPEQADGHPDELTEHSDIYSLGVILFEMLCFELPVEGKNATDVIKNTIRGRLKAFDFSLRAQRSEPELAAVCAKALALKPKDRYTSIRAMSNDIRGIIEDRPISVYQGNMFSNSLRWIRHNQTRAVLICTIALLLIVGIVVGTSVSAVLAKNRAEVAQSNHEIAVFAQQSLKEKLVAEQEKAEQEKQLRIQHEHNAAAFSLYMDARDLASRPGKWSKALDFLEDAIELNPNFVEALFLRASIYRQLRDYGHALKDCIAAHEISVKQTGRGHPHALSIAGDIWRERDDGLADQDKALRYYQQIVSMDSKNPYAEFAMIFIEFQQSGRDAALFKARACVSDFPDYWEPHYLLGYLHLGRDRIGKAQIAPANFNASIDAFTQAIRLQPSESKLYQNRGAAYIFWYNSGESRQSNDPRIDLAIKDYEISAALDPHNPLQWRNLLKLHYNVKNDFRRSLQIINELERVSPDAANLEATRAFCYEGLQQYQKALDSIKKALKRDPENASFISFQRDMKLKLAEANDQDDLP